MGNVYSTQPPVSNYAGNQPQADMKPSTQDINQQTKPASQAYGTYGYPQQQNVFPGQNYQPVQGSGSYPKPTGQPEQYGTASSMVHGYRQPQGGTITNQPVQGVGTQQASVTGNTVYSAQPSFQTGQLPSGSPYNHSVNWVPTQNLPQPNQAPGQPFSPNYQGSPQAYPNQYPNTVSSPTASYPNPYVTNSSPYTRNVGNEYGQRNQSQQQTLSPLPNFPLTGSPSDMYIKNINRILQQTSALLPQVEQFRGKRGSVLQYSLLTFC